MSKKLSAGILLYRFRKGKLEVFLVHPGGPFWAKRNVGAWMIPKGEVESGENLLEAARREFKEEVGVEVDGKFIDLGTVRQSGGKLVHIWALEKDIEIDKVKSNTFKIEWPKGSGVIREFPEVDKGNWFPIKKAENMILKSQKEFLSRLVKVLNHRRSGQEKGERRSSLLDFLKKP